MYRICFICHGNICRSPMAEFMLKDKVKKLGKSDEFIIDSMAVSREEIGNDIYPPAKDKLKEKGIDFSKRRARQITSNDYQNYDYIICMDKSNLRYLSYLIDDYDHKVSMLLDRDIADPWYTGDFEATYKDLDEGLDDFLQELIFNG
ncbi:MAG: low molecular weight phosphotyrosine protein phosphatase [Bacilli bacterium]|nr:low molecular weight phosphotyrosine protein phosphatase [Bacilli bacterium]